MADHVIPFEPRQRLIEKAGGYLDDVRRFVEEIDAALPLLLRVMKIADASMIDRIMLLLGGIADPRVVWALYTVMADSETDETLRYRASVQLNITAAMIDDTEEITDRLLADLEDPDPANRRHATFALGWKGNTRAAMALIERLYDSDADVQQAAVNALGNLEDDRIVGLMMDRLASGPAEQKRVILYNLWRFDSRKADVLKVYYRYLQHPDIDLRCTALELLCLLEGTERVAPVIDQCLSDASNRLRRHALWLLQASPDRMHPSLRPRLAEMARDSDPAVRSMAADLLKRF